MPVPGTWTLTNKEMDMKLEWFCLGFLTNSLLYFSSTHQWGWATFVFVCLVLGFAAALVKPCKLR